MLTCKQANSIQNLIFVNGVFEEVVTFKVFIRIGEDGSVFEADGGGGCSVVKDYLLYGFIEQELKLNVILAGEVVVDCLC